MAIDVRLLRKGDQDLLAEVPPGVFDDRIAPEAAREFLDDPRHHLAVALDDEVIVGFAPAVHYVHPDMARPELWINEVAVAETHRKRGLGKSLLSALVEVGEALGCSEAWVLTDRSNTPAMHLYTSAGFEHAKDQVMFTIRLSRDDAAG